MTTRKQTILQNNGELCSASIQKKTGTAEFTQGEITIECKSYTLSEALDGVKELIKQQGKVKIPK